MSDDIAQRGPQDKSRINISQDREVRYWTRALGVSEADLCRAVGSVGASAEKVRAYFHGQVGAGDKSGNADSFQAH